jgi:hypothetical protein
MRRQSIHANVNSYAQPAALLRLNPVVALLFTRPGAPLVITQAKKKTI